MSIAGSILTQYFPDARDRENGFAPDGEIAAQKHQGARPACELGQDLDKIADFGGRQKLRLHVQGHAMRVVAHIPRRLTERRVGERHEHPAMDHAAHVHVSILDDEGEPSRAFHALLEDRADVAFEGIDQFGLSEAGGLSEYHR